MNFDYWLCRICLWFAHFTYCVANSTGCNPVYTRKYHEEWQQWLRYFEILELRRNV